MSPYRRRGSGGLKIRLIIAVVMAGFALISFIKSKEYNPVTGETQYISITPRQEIALGLQAAPQMIQQHGGHYPDQTLQRKLDEIGERLVQSGAARDTGWQFDFHLLSDAESINAFALPGGQVFITAALFGRLSTEGQVAGVLGHEIGHVVARHGAQRIAKSNLTRGLARAVLVASGTESGRMAEMIAQMVNMKYGREDELESDRLGVRFMADAGYDPRSMVGVMKVLAEAGGSSRQPEFFSTHPNPANRIEEIENAILATFPEGIPGGLIQ
jgi:predicted Zn-dependent protease